VIAEMNRQLERLEAELASHLGAAWPPSWPSWSWTLRSTRQLAKAIRRTRPCRDRVSAHYSWLLARSARFIKATAALCGHLKKLLHHPRTLVTTGQLKASKRHGTRLGGTLTRITTGYRGRSARWGVSIGLVVAGLATAGGLTLAQAASATTTTINGGYNTASVENGTMTVEADEYDSSATDTMTTDGNADFTVTDSAIDNATNGSPGAYNAIYEGCHWGSCTSNDPFPIEVSSMGSNVSTSVTTTQEGGSNAYDVAYDIWYNQMSMTSGQPNGEEMMIWLNRDGSVQPYGSEVATGVSIGGQTFNVWEGSETSAGVTWKCVTYQLSTGVTSSSFNLGPLVSDSESRGYMNSSWYLIDIEMGFELWQGGTGNEVNSFSVSTSGSGSTTTAATTTTTKATTTTTKATTTTTKATTTTTAATRLPLRGGAARARRPTPCRRSTAAASSGS
jgi:cellulose 1,4-beta-cellobiosidase